MPRRSRSARALSRLTLEFGNLHVPVLVLPTAETRSLPVTPVMVDPASGEMQRVTFEPVTEDGRIVPGGEVSLGVQFGEQAVLLSEPRIREAIGLGATTPLHQFVTRPSAERTYSVVNRYLVAADTEGRPSRQRQVLNAALDALLTALRAEDAVAILTTTFTGTPRFAALDGDGGLATLYYGHEQVRDIDLPPAADLTEEVRIRARMIVARARSNVALPLEDPYGPALRDGLTAESPAEATHPDVSLPTSMRALSDTLTGSVGEDERTPFTRVRRRMDTEGRTLSDQVRNLSNTFRSMRNEMSGTSDALRQMQDRVRADDALRTRAVYTPPRYEYTYVRSDDWTNDWITVPMSATVSSGDMFTYMTTITTSS